MEKYRTMAAIDVGSASIRLKVIQIAEEVGYNNDQSFLRAFKKWVGMSPAVYRKERNS